MSFNPPAQTIMHWKETGSTPATDEAIAIIESRLGLKAPRSYIDFMKAFGNVRFGFDVNCSFEYSYEQPDRTEKRNAAISFIKTPQRALQYYEGLQRDEKINLPPHLFPFGMDYGQGELLIEFGQPTQRVFYWDFDAHDWESGCTRIGFVANDMYDFINHLKPVDD